MAFYPPKPLMPLLMVAIGAMVLSAAAQQSGRSIIFSSPPNDDGQSSFPSLAPAPTPPSLPGSMQAPVSPFGYDAPANDHFNFPPPSANAADQQRMQKMLDDRKNWTLMTPAEIFGNPMDKSLQPVEHDAWGREKIQTPLERYMDRQNQLFAGRTNGWRNDRENSPWNSTYNQDRLNPNSRLGNSPENANRFFGGQPNSGPNQNGEVSWDAFSSAPPAQAPVKPNLEQLAAMDRFRQLLEPGPAPVETSPNSSFLPAPKPVVDPNFTRPAFTPNPVGASFTPLTSGIGRPAGLTPLPGITTPVTHPATAPSWAPQPPPWVSQSPQPFAAPQWKF